MPTAPQLPDYGDHRLEYLRADDAAHQRIEFAIHCVGCGCHHAVHMRKHEAMTLPEPRVRLLAAELHHYFAARFVPSCAEALRLRIVGSVMET